MAHTPVQTTETAEGNETRLRILDAAGEVFAERGFQNATTREICEKAGANRAAVNYHFHNKEMLYGAVLRFAHSCALREFPPTMGLAENATPWERLHAFVRAFLLRVFNEGRGAWLGKLMAREMIEPTRALDDLVQQTVGPQKELISAIVRDILGPQASADSDRVMYCATSVVGQCIFHYNCRAVIERLFPELAARPHEERIDLLAEHIAKFSFMAMTMMGHEAGRPGGREVEKK